MEVENKDDGAVGKEVNVISLEQPNREAGRITLRLCPRTVPFGMTRVCKPHLLLHTSAAKFQPMLSLVWNKVAAYQPLSSIS